MDTTIKAQEIIDIYKTLLEQENSNHTIFIYVLMGITIIILGATWWWNKTGANSYIKKAVKNELEKKNEEISLLIDNKISEAVEEKFKEIEEKFKNLELELYRSFAFSIETEKNYTYSIFYWSKALEKAIEIEEGELIRAFVDTVLYNIKKLEKKEGNHCYLCPYKESCK